MAGTTAQTLLLTSAATDQTLSGAATIKAFSATTPAATNYGSVTGPASVASTDITIIPGAANSTAGDTTNNNGWVVNNGGVEGLQSTAATPRFVPAGVWNLGIQLSFPANPATYTTNATVQLIANVYRVATGGGARTLLFSASSAVVSSSAIAAVNQQFLATSASQPAIFLAAGEVLMVGFIIRSTGYNNALNQPNAVTVTPALGANSGFTTPAPGIRTNYPGTPASESVPIGTSTSARVFLPYRQPAASIPIQPETLVRAAVTARSDTESYPIQPETVTRPVQFVRTPAAESNTVIDAIVRLAQFGRASSETYVIQPEVVSRPVSFVRSTPPETIPTPVDSVARGLINGRSDAEYLGAFQPDYPISPGSTKTISGTIRDEDTNVVVAGVTVILVRISDNRVVQTTTSAGDGTYSFLRDNLDPNTYFINAYIASTPQKHGVSDRGLAPV